MKFSKKALSIFLLAAALSSSFVMPGAHAMFSESSSPSSAVLTEGKKIYDPIISEFFDEINVKNAILEKFGSVDGAPDLDFMERLKTDSELYYSLAAGMKLMNIDEFFGKIVGCLYETLKEQGKDSLIRSIDKKTFVTTACNFPHEPFLGNLTYHCNGSDSKFHFAFWSCEVFPMLYARYSRWASSLVYCFDE